MDHLQRVPRRQCTHLCWLTRMLSILVTGAFLLIGVLAVVNEDKPQGAAVPILALLALTMLATLAAWRWERAGGFVVALLALCLGAASYSASQALELRSLSLLLALLYGIPFLAVGSLFWICGQKAAGASPPNLAPPSPLRRQWRFIVAVLAATVVLTATVVALLTGARVGGWLDVALNASGCLGVVAEHDSPVQSVAFSPQGGLLAAGSKDGTVRVWRMADDGLAGWTLLHARAVPTGEKDVSYSHDVAFSPDGTVLAFGLPDGSVRLWQASGGALLHILEGESGKICSLAFSPDGRVLATGTWDGLVNLWRISDRALVRTLEGHTRGVVSVAFSPDDATVASASLDGTVRVWDGSTGALIRELDRHPVTTGVAFSPDGSMLATDRQLWRVDDWTPTETMASGSGGMGNVAFSPDGKLLAAGNAWYEVRWWRVADGALLRTVKGHTDSVNSVAFSPDGKRLASGSLDGTVKLWRVP